MYLPDTSSWYSLGSAYRHVRFGQPQSAWIECDGSGSVTASLGYSGYQGDQVLLWDYANQVWATYTRNSDGTWDPADPYIAVDRGFMLMPAHANSWVENNQIVVCP